VWVSDRAGCETLKIVPSYIFSMPCECALYLHITPPCEIRRLPQNCTVIQGSTATVLNGPFLWGTRTPPCEIPALCMRGVPQRELWHIYTQNSHTNIYTLLYVDKLQIHSVYLGGGMHMHAHSPIPMPRPIHCHCRAHRARGLCRKRYAIHPCVASVTQGPAPSIEGVALVPEVHSHVHRLAVGRAVGGHLHLGHDLARTHPPSL
jgi:hypothetical protein